MGKSFGYKLSPYYDDDWELSDDLTDDFFSSEFHSIIHKNRFKGLKNKNNQSNQEPTQEKFQ